MSDINRDVSFEQLIFINTEISKLQVFPALGWVWCFDIIKDTFDNHQNQEHNDEVIAEGVTLKQIFDKFYTDIDSLGIDMDMGGEILEETILDWMRENDFLVALDEDGWLE